MTRASSLEWPKFHRVIGFLKQKFLWTKCPSCHPTTWQPAALKHSWPPLLCRNVYNNNIGYITNTSYNIVTVALCTNHDSNVWNSPPAHMCDEGIPCITGFRHGLENVLVFMLLLGLRTKSCLIVLTELNWTELKDLLWVFSCWNG